MKYSLTASAFATTSMIFTALHMHPCFVRGFRANSLSLSWRRRSITSSLFGTASASTDSTRTQYTIDDAVCPPIDHAELQKLVSKHCTTLPKFMSKRPIVYHTQDVFDLLQTDYVQKQQPIILDSGCGTGRSTRMLAEQYPNYMVIGVDRSFVRLTKNIEEAEEATDINNNEKDADEEHPPMRLSKQPVMEQISDNCLLVRAELIDFWRCCIQHNWNIEKHYVLYPNPYPKKNRIKQRFYAHPAFSLLLGVGGDLTVRSNWKEYLQEFALSVQFADEALGKINMNDHDSNLPQDLPRWAAPYVASAKEGPRERLDKSVSLTNFEKKFDAVGERTYKLYLPYRKPSESKRN